MFSVPYSRYILYPVPWYSFLIVVGVALAVFLAGCEERRLGIKKDTVIDLVLWLLPFGIIGARIYYVIFSWDQFRPDPLSVLRIWEGGIAIYGAVIADLVVIVCFSRHRSLSSLLLCDMFAPGLALAQAIGRWGNYFNMEAYGLPLHNSALCIFPLAVQITENGSQIWHMATFFYESVWDLSVFCFLMFARHRFLRHKGDTFFFYVFLYASGRFVIEDLRMDSLFISSSVRTSQLLSALACIGIILYYLILIRRTGSLNAVIRFLVIPVVLISSGFQLLYSLSGVIQEQLSFFTRLLLLSGSSLSMIASLFTIFPFIHQEVTNADNQV